jgi:acetyl-CoA carboxylase biotin carboxyl carrier protein
MLTDDDVREILRIIDESPLEELRIETSGFSLHVRRGGSSEVVRSASTETETIAAPSMGTFYRAEGPGEDPFVDVGTRVEPDTVVGIIEIMKMMNSVPAGVSGTVVEVCAENAQIVQDGEALFRVEVAA